MPHLYTIGHSSRSLEEFLALLELHNITHLVDVRTIPRSRHVPWFNKEELASTLNKKGISYFHMPGLGGLRHTSLNSINQEWRNTSFRGFADYMQTPQFYAALKALNTLLRRNRKVVIMCSEAVPWRCHRSLIADAEIVRGISVIDIISTTSAHPHTLTPFAVVDRSKRPIKIYYPKNKGKKPE